MLRHAFLAIFLATSLHATELVVNGSFERNNGLETNELEGWTHSDIGPGSWFVQKGFQPSPSSYACSEIFVPAPPSGFAAMENSPSKGSRLLYQDVTIPKGVKATFSFDLSLTTPNGFNPQPSFDETLLNQQFRADIMDPSAPLRDTGSGVLLNVYQTKTGDPTKTEYKRISADISAFAGRTIRIRFGEVDHQFCLLPGIDNVSIDITPIASIDQFEASSTTVTWKFSGATSASLYDRSTGTSQFLGTVGPSGSMQVSGSSSAVYKLALDGGPADEIAQLNEGATSAALATIASDFRSTAAIAIDPATNELLVSDPDVPAIVRIAPHGRTTRVAAQAGGGVAVDRDGNLYIADTIDHEIRKIAPDGTLTHFAGSNSNRGNVDDNGIHARFDSPTSITFDTNGDLLVADTGNRAVRRVTMKGDVTTIARLDVAPRWLAVAPNGAIYAASENDVRLASSGAVVYSSGGPIATDSSGNLYLSSNNTLTKIGSGPITGPTVRFDAPTAMTIARDGRIYVADRDSVRVVVVPSTNTPAPTRRRSAR